MLRQYRFGKVNLVYLDISNDSGKCVTTLKRTHLFQRFPEMCTIDIAVRLWVCHQNKEKSVSIDNPLCIHCNHIRVHTLRALNQSNPLSSTNYPDILSQLQLSAESGVKGRSNNTGAGKYLLHPPSDTILNIPSDARWE